VTVVAGRAGTATTALPSGPVAFVGPDASVASVASGWPRASAGPAGPGALAGPGVPWRLPALWLTVALLLVGLVLVGVGHRHAVAMPAVLALAAVLFALHGLLLWLAVHWLDLPARRPPWLRATALAWGGLVAVGVAGYANSWLASALVKVASPALVARLTPLGAPTVEESVKLLGVVTLVLLARHRLAGAVDGLVYGALIGLGFQEMENVHYVLVEAAAHHHGTLAAFGHFVGRGVLAGWATHVGWTAVAGAGLAWALRHRDRAWPVRIGVAAAAFGGAWALHALWNSPLGFADGLRYGPDGLFRLASLNLLGLAPAAMVAWLALRGEARRWGRALVGLADPAVAVDTEIAALGSPVRRFRIRWAAYVAGGRTAAAAVRRLHRAQAALALSLVNGAPEPDGGVPALRAAVLAARAQLGAALPARGSAGGGLGERGAAGSGCGGVALGVGLVGPVGLWVASALGLVELAVPATSVAAGALAGCGGAALLLAGRAVLAARRSGAAADVRYGVAALLGVASCGLAAVFGGQLVELLVR
jgi:RsiW-degrading membrane proteinase PrsW (M82 family)